MEETLVPGASPVPGALYRHYKGGEYRVVRVGTREADVSPVVIYHAKDDPGGRWWLRPLDEWREKVDGVPRFQRIREIESFDSKYDFLRAMRYHKYRDKVIVLSWKSPDWRRSFGRYLINPELDATHIAMGAKNAPEETLDKALQWAMNTDTKYPVGTPLPKITLRRVLRWAVFLLIGVWLIIASWVAWGL